MINFKKIKSNYERHFLGYDFLLAIILLMIFIWSINAKVINFDDFFLKDSRQKLYSSITSISGSLVGFIIASLAILVAFPENDSLKKLKISKRYSDIFVTFISTCKYLTVSLFLSMGTSILDKNTIISNCSLIFFYANIFSIIISTFRIFRCIWILENLLKLSLGK